MLMRLARQTYVRQYVEFTYLFGKVTARFSVILHESPRSGMSLSMKS